MSTPLRQKMINDMKLRRFSKKTQYAYISAVAGLAKFYNLSPDRIDKHRVQAYLLHLMDAEKKSWSTCNIVVSGLRFFYTKTLGRDSIYLEIPPRKKNHQLPEILSSSEIESLFASTDNPKNRTLLMTTYAAGLRVSEVVKLKITDIDSNRMMIRIEQGKGRKDRYTILSPRLLTELRHYYRKYLPELWLFQGRIPEHYLSVGTAQKIYYRAKKRAGIKKGKGIHILRHVTVHSLQLSVFRYNIKYRKGLNVQKD